MLMKDKKKQDIAMILSQKLDKPEEGLTPMPENEEGTEMDSSVGYQAAADEMIRAFEAKDSNALVEALKSFVDMCRDEIQPENDSEEVV